MKRIMLCLTRRWALIASALFLVMLGVLPTMAEDWLAYRNEFTPPDYNPELGRGVNAPGTRGWNVFDTDPRLFPEYLPPPGSRVYGSWGPAPGTRPTLTLENLPPHSAIKVEFFLIIDQGWDGNGDPNSPDPVAKGSRTSGD